ncbi:MAG: hypothetical protein IK026_03645 [Eubacteriaceae bacterium]|nr:hypothetical protein [Eubacteriaceae bacterium]MBR5995653.1 hypothetical protein [Eubacteriaceae bacterium]
MSDENCKECSNTHECPCSNVKCKNYKRCCDCLAKHLSHGGLPACAKNVVKAKDE